MKRTMTIALLAAVHVVMAAQASKTTWSGGAGPDMGDVFSQFFGERFGSGGSANYEDIFSHLGRGGGGATGGRRRAARPQPGADIHAELEVPLATSVLGGEAQITVRRGSGKVDTITVKIPAGIGEGKEIRLRGQGEQPEEGLPPGDLLIRLRVASHPWFQRRGKVWYIESCMQNPAS